jgi:DNA mismatch endonuclease (patch repair protein)
LRIDAGGIKVRPDIVFTRGRLAVFIDGCFWHCCPEHGRPPKANIEYWGPKLDRNRRRDEVHTAALVAAGWDVVRIWEHVPVLDGIEIVAKAFADWSDQSRGG